MHHAIGGMAMFGSVVLEVAIGLAYLYLLLSVICSALNEGLAGLLALRAKTLAAALRNLLDDSTVDALYAHPLIQGLSGAGRPPISRRACLRRRYWTSSTPRRSPPRRQPSKQCGPTSRRCQMGKSNERCSHWSTRPATICRRCAATSNCGSTMRWTVCPDGTNAARR